MLVVDDPSSDIIPIWILFPLAVAAIQLALPQAKARNHSHPHVESFVMFDEPNFKVKVGDFRTRLEAYVFLQHIRGEFPGTIIRDNIYPTQINWDEMVPESENDI